MIASARILPAFGRLWRTVLTAFFLLATLHGAGLAHALILSSEPPVDGVVTGPTVSVRLHFNSRIDREHSKLSILTADDRESPVTLSEESTEDTLIGQVTDLPPGQYRLRWQVLSVDGHITRGDIPFRVTAP